MNAKRSLSAVVLLGVLATPVALAGPVNAGFEDDLSGWTSSGTAASVEQELYRDFLPPRGGPKYWTATEGNKFASLWSTNSADLNQTMLSQSFTAKAGQILTFDYFFDFGDVFAAGPDTAVGTLLLPGSSIVLFEHNTPGNELGDAQNVGWATIEATLPEDGLYTLVFEVTDANGAFESILGVDNVALIPEPGTSLLAVSLLAIALRRRVSVLR